MSSEHRAVLVPFFVSGKTWKTGRRQVLVGEDEGGSRPLFDVRAQGRKARRRHWMDDFPGGTRARCLHLPVLPPAKEKRARDGKLINILGGKK